jgi:hypothetical protein
MTRFTALAAPALMLFYGVTRFFDGLDGDRGDSWLWDAGHVAFFFAIVLFAILGERLRRLHPGVLTTVAEAATVFGAACFLWVITGDLFDSWPGLPSALELVGPALFQLGLLTLLVRHAAARGIPAWSPLLVLLGFVAIPLSLDLLPLAAILIGAGLLPLAVGRRSSLPMHGR